MLSGDGGSQAFGIDVEKKECQDGLLWDAIRDVVTLEHTSSKRQNST